jgi:DUF4097 and DUF4098 domain-containing protein YvlB
MPTFDTPDPITLTVDATVGAISVNAEDRHDTIVDVHPRNAANEADVHAAEHTNVDYADGHLVIKTPRPRGFAWFGRDGSVDISISLPSGSIVSCTTAAGDLSCTGRLGDCQLKTAAGQVRVEETGSAQLITAQGDITAQLIGGEADVSTSSGTVRVGTVHGRGSLKTSAGDCVVGTADGRLRIKTAAGDITVQRAATDVEASTAMGDVTVGSATSGSIRLSTASGALSVGIAPGTTAFLDLDTTVGQVCNYLNETDGPSGSESTVEVRARTYHGDITVHRS